MQKQGRLLVQAYDEPVSIGRRSGGWQVLVGPHNSSEPLRLLRNRDTAQRNEVGDGEFGRVGSLLLVPAGHSLSQLDENENRQAEGGGRGRRGGGEAGGRGKQAGRLYTMLRSLYKTGRLADWQSRLSKDAQSGRRGSV